MNAYGQYYSKISDDMLFKLAGEVATLVPAARDSLKLEMKHRGLPVEQVDWASQPVVEQPKVSDGKLRPVLQNFLVFLGFGVLGSILTAVLLAFVKGIDVEQVEANLMQICLKGSIALGLITGLMGIKRRTVWIAGLLWFPITLVVITIIVLVRR